ncbi:MAG TPA: FtsX-like permease family protein [Steroidobacteraceae bacterium]|nr:FtsX-like permease family protein [Steroidobacteraceae bacterium]
MIGLRQIAAVCLIGIGSLRDRYGTALVIVTGMACVVGVLTSMLSLTSGLRRAYLRPEDATRAIVWAGHATFDQSRSLHPDAIATILDAPGIARGPGDVPLADAEFLMRLLSMEGFAAGSLQLRGVGPAGLALRPAFRIVAGRMFRSGTRELVVGVGAARRFGLGVGNNVRLRDGAWPIAGVFSCGGDIIESYLVGDALTVMAARRRAGFAQVLVQLTDAGAFPAFEKWLTGNPALTVSVERKTDYDLRTAGANTAFFTRMSFVIGGIMALGALFAIVKIMYGAVRARTREIGTLRAIGFGPLPVAVSVLVEAALLGAIGALLGTAIAWLMFDGREMWVWGAFRLRVSPLLWVLGLLWALVTCLLGGLMPALRAARLAPAEALRSE